jgi:hypothetical protein
LHPGKAESHPGKAESQSFLIVMAVLAGKAYFSEINKIRSSKKLKKV